MLRSTHRVRRVYFNDLADNEPVKQHAYHGQVLLYRGFCKSLTQALDIARDMHGLHIFQNVHAVLGAEFREPAGSNCSKPAVYFCFGYSR
jgi:hypothetical protein